MDFISTIKEETLIICNKYIKEKILKLNKLLPIKIISINELKENYYFSYDENAILYIIKKYNTKYEIAKEYIENIYYIEDRKYNNEKLDFLVNLKKDLDSQNLLIYNNSFKEYLERVNIVICGIQINNFIKKILKGKKYEEIKEKEKKYDHTIYEFNTIEEEVNFIAKEIAKQIDNGIKPNKIKLMNLDENYYNVVNRIFLQYNIITSIKYQRPLSSYNEVKKFIDNCKIMPLNSAIELIDKDIPIYDDLISVINKYIKYENIELIIYKLNKTYIESEKYTNEIELVDYLEYPTSDDEYYYLVNFNEGAIPKSYTDTSYITDNIKQLLNLETTKELNKELRENIIKIINNTKNITITYKLSDNTKTYYPSSLQENFNIEKKEIDQSISYSEIYNKIALAKEYDSYIKYGTKNKLFDILSSNYEIPYNSYSNKYRNINRVQEKLNLSYSKLQIYNKCAFRYYLTDILKLDIYEENFSATIGSMVHFVMEKCLSNNDYDINKYVSIFLEDKKLTKKETFFLNKYKNEIQSLLNQILLEKEYSELNEAKYEEKIDIDLGENIHFIGIIDKIMYLKENNNTYIAIVDYKTGMDDISLKYLEYGINIQLPIYLYLVSNLDFKNPKYVGFYLQKFNINDKDYRLVGYSNSNKDIISKLDKNYDNSKIIKSLKTLKDGSFAKTSRVLDDDKIEEIKKEVVKIITNTVQSIKSNRFEINPKITIEKNIGCEYCKFNDICFKTKQDEQLIYAKGDE